MFCHHTKLGGHMPLFVTCFRHIFAKVVDLKIYSISNTLLLSVVITALDSVGKVQFIVHKF